MDMIMQQQYQGSVEGMTIVEHEHSGDQRKLYNIQHEKHNMYTRGKQMGERWMRICQNMNHHGGSVSG
jgi:hypothetical protein